MGVSQLIKDFFSPPDTEHYLFLVTCQNCGHPEPLYIPKGMTIEEFTKNPSYDVCPECKCKKIVAFEQK